MADERRVQELLLELLTSRRTPEEVCATCPELLPEIRERWLLMGQVRADLDALFPPPSEPGTPPPTTLSSDARSTISFSPPSETGMSPPEHSAEDTALPRIPGYEVEAVLGRGGMGVVYKARHVRLNRPVALKMLVAGACAGPHERERFAREAEAVAGLRHANIVQVYDVGDHEGRPYFTMEFVEGGSLDHKLAGLPLPARQAAALAATLAEAVQVAHQGGIMHRDLKPANVLLTDDGTPKIADFGLARRLAGGAGLTLSGVTVGTPSYMAPEQARGQTRALGPAVDVYALGALLYEMLTGRPPFCGETASETMLQVIYQEPVPPSRLNARVPRDLETVCLKCLRKEPRQRYGSAQELAEDVRRFLRSEPIRARPVGAVGKLWRWVRRHPVPAGLLAAGLLAPVVALITLSLLSARLVRSCALESAAQQAELLEEATREYSRNVRRVEQASFLVNKTIPPTPGTVPLSIPATFLHDVGEQLSRISSTGVKVRQYSDKPFPWRTDSGPRDEFEREALRRLRQSRGQETLHEFTEMGGQRVVRYAQARIMQRSCVECHNSHPQSPRKDWQEGDVRGVLEIIRPLDKDEARVGEALRLALLLSAVVSALLLGGSMLVVWAGRKRTY
jgi:serine/threonine-protein kinase